MINYVQFTKRTNDPKLFWLECQLMNAGIKFRRNGESWHAPILEVDESRLDDAWNILNPVDDIPDDDEQYVQFWNDNQDYPIDSEANQEYEYFR